MCNAQESNTNPFTGQPYSSQYKKILEARKKLPVYAQMDQFYKQVSYMLRLSDRLSEPWARAATESCATIGC